MNDNQRPLDPLDFLLAVDDSNRVGALRLQNENCVFQRVADAGRRVAPPLLELRQLLSATRAVETNTETALDLAYLRGRGTSLGGMRPKCSVIDDAGRLLIGKFPSVTDERAVTKGEVLALRLARMAGIAAAVQWTSRGACWRSINSRMRLNIVSVWRLEELRK